MLMIRFQRVGRKNDPAFRLVVALKRSKPQTGGLELLGSYHPKTKEAVLHAERIRHWLEYGAQASPTVLRLLYKKNILTPKGAGEKSLSVSGKKPENRSAEKVIMQ
ncbi:MAG: 30S ribosomal protein S16 [Candidatus Sungbacteria bacterium]|nr:30S ribosomal protein S16 [Candidatus Sungbacteria bacterium]